MKTHRCEKSLERNTSIRFETNYSKHRWTIRDYTGYVDYDPQWDVIHDIDYCPFCGADLNAIPNKFHYENPLPLRLEAYKILKNWAAGGELSDEMDDYIYSNFSFTKWDWDEHTFVKKAIGVDSENAYH